MKIKKLSIKNYRSCIETVFEPHSSLSALIGPNGSGKTNVLSAIKLLPALSTIRRHVAGQVEPSAPSEIKTWFDLDGKTLIHNAQLSIVTNEKNQDEIISAAERWYMKDFTGSKKQVHLQSWVLADITRELRVGNNLSASARSRGMMDYLRTQGVNQDNLPVLQQAHQFMSNITYYSASQFTNPGTSPLSFDVEADSNRRTGISISGHKKFLYDLYQEKRNKTDVYAEFRSLVGPEGVGLIEEVVFNEIKTSSSNYSVMTGGKVVIREKTNLLVVPSFKVAGNSLSPSQLSEGTFKALALVFYLVTDKSSILMIEEPEVCVHHGLLLSIIELIKLYSKGKQVFISTHSDAVLDQLSFDNVFRVFRTKKGTEIASIKKRLRGVELVALKDYLANEGSLGEYWKHGDLENV